MDSRSVAILAPRWGRTGDWTLQRRYGSRLSPLPGQDRLFTKADLRVHDPEIGVHDAERGVHDDRNERSRSPKRLFTMLRNGRSRSAETRTPRTNELERPRARGAN